jgi:membrane-bound lytic murein transglycosylase MltF
VQFKKKYLYSLVILLALGFGTILWRSGERHPFGTVSDQKRIKNIDMALPLPESREGDLDEMLDCRLVRILVPYSRTSYFLDRGQERGITHDAGMELQKWLNHKYENKTMPVRVIFIPTSRQHLLQDLVNGLGDIAAGNLTITPERMKSVDFTENSARTVDEIVVTGPASLDLKKLADLATVPVYVRESSSYYQHLIKLVADQNLKLNIQLADDAMEDEDFLEMVNAGLLPLAVVDDHKAAFCAQIFTDINLRKDLIVNLGGRVAWAIRKDSPKLLAELNDFGRVEGAQKGLANMLLKRYLVSTRHVKMATNAKEIAKFAAMKDLFRKYGDMYGLDYLLLLAQGYQESRLDQSARSPAGAVGIMQVLPSTAEYEKVQIENIENNTEQNIHAGVKYMRHLLDTYLSDPSLDSTNKLLLGLAMYNTGPGNMRKVRRRASEMGLDPNVWFKNVEHSAAQLYRT